MAQPSGNNSPTGWGRGDGIDAVTTLMLQNVPRKCTTGVLASELEASVGMDVVNFVYLPWDSRGSCNLGIAFVNFTSPQAAQNARSTLSATTWRCLKSPRRMKVLPAYVQGLVANLACCAGKVPPNADDEHSPLVWHEGEFINFQDAVRLYTQGGGVPLRAQPWPQSHPHQLLQQQQQQQQSAQWVYSPSHAQLEQEGELPSAAPMWGSQRGAREQHDEARWESATAAGPPRAHQHTPAAAQTMPAAAETAFERHGSAAFGQVPLDSPILEASRHILGSSQNSAGSCVQAERPGVLAWAVAAAARRADASENAGFGVPSSGPRQIQPQALVSAHNSEWPPVMPRPGQGRATFGNDAPGASGAPGAGSQDLREADVYRRSCSETRALIVRLMSRLPPRSPLA